MIHLHWSQLQYMLVHAEIVQWSLTYDWETHQLVLMMTCKLIQQSSELVHLSLQQQFPKLYAFWSVWDLALCLQSEQPHLSCYCSHNELWTYLYLYLSYQELMCHYVLKEFHSVILCLYFEKMSSFFISAIFLLKFLIFMQSNFTPPGTSWNRFAGICGKMFFLSLCISFSTCSDTWIWLCV